MIIEPPPVDYPFQKTLPAASIHHIVIGQFTMDMTYDSTVKHHKAVEWLMQNDHVFRVLMDTMKMSPFNAFAVVDEYGNWIRERVAQVAERMEVTEQERAEGYPLPKDEAERARRMWVRQSADLSR